jgi:hypothetical protein
VAAFGRGEAIVWGRVNADTSPVREGEGGAMAVG